MQVKWWIVLLFCLCCDRVQSSVRIIKLSFSSRHRPHIMRERVEAQWRRRSGTVRMSTWSNFLLFSGFSLSHLNGQEFPLQFPHFTLSCFYIDSKLNGSVEGKEREAIKVKFHREKKKKKWLIAVLRRLCVVLNFSTFLLPSIFLLLFQLAVYRLIYDISPLASSWLVEASCLVHTHRRVGNKNN